MTSYQTRPKSQAMSRNSFDVNSQSNRGFKTRVVYKNVKEEYDPNDKRSLYGATISKVGVKPQTPQQQQQPTLADVTSMKRVSSARSPVFSKGDIEVQSQNGQKAKQRVPTPGGNGARSTGTGGSPGFGGGPNTLRQGSKIITINYPPSVGNDTEKQKAYDSQVLKDAIKRQFANSQYININNEADYYEAVRKLDVCGKCWAAQQKYYSAPFKLGSKLPKQTLYQRDYVKHPLEDQGPVLKNDFYSTWQNNEPVDYGTTMANDYKPWKVGPPKKETMNWKPATTGIPFAGTSNYKTDYANWPANTAAHEKAPYNKTVIPELPFMGNTTYGDTYKKPDAASQLKPVDRDLWKQKDGKSPVTTGLPFMGESTNAATYKPFQVTPFPNFDAPEEYQPTEALPEHMRSLYAKDFASPLRDKCPAVIFMEQNPHPKFKHLSA